MKLMKKDFYPTYMVTEEQLKDIDFMLTHLNVLDTALESRQSKHKWGDGFRAIPVSPIPVKTDARGVEELLGWLVLEEIGWSFTQNPPQELLEAISETYGVEF